MKDTFHAAIPIFIKFSFTRRDTSSVGYADSFSSRRSHFWIALRSNASLKDTFHAAITIFIKFSFTRRDTSSVGCADSFSSRRSHFASHLRCRCIHAHTCHVNHPGGIAQHKLSGKGAINVLSTPVQRSLPRKGAINVQNSHNINCPERVR